MASVNKVILVGRLTRDVETKTFQSGGKVAQMGFAVNNRKKNQAGEWVDDPCFVDLKAFNRESGRKLADLCEQYLHKGDLAYIEGHLVLEQWEKDGQKRSALKIIIDDVQFLTPKAQTGMGNGKAPAAASAGRSAAPQESGHTPFDGAPASHGAAEDIPF